MTKYSIRENLRAVLYTFINPGKLVNNINSMPLSFGVVVFVVYLVAAELSWLLAWSSDDYHSLGALAQVLPTDHPQYPVYMAIIGPVIKLAGVAIFIFVFRWLSFSNLLDRQAYRALINLYLLVGSVLSLLALVLDQFLLWGDLGTIARYSYIFIHLVVVILLMTYLVSFVSRQINYSTRRAIYTVVPAVLLSVPVPSLLFH